MGIVSFIEGPLWWIVALLFLVGITFRVIIALWGLIQKRSWWIPLGQTFFKKPLYVFLRYLFHILMIVTPIWMAGHIILWEESRFNWRWTPLPDAWADWFTLIVLGFLVFFLLRRVLIPRLREVSEASDYGLILLAGLPFLSGYLLSHGNLEGISFFRKHLMTIHILCGEAMILTALFLFIKPFINRKICTGCSACDMQCPTGALAVTDTNGIRKFFHKYSLCISCAKCVSTCPEEAVTLKHKISLGKFFSLFALEPIRDVEMERCKACGVFIAPVPLFRRVEERQQSGFEHLCNECKKTDLAVHIFQSFPNRGSA
jgi:Pyruvate/2-oxoacid:ferredoxin oxidoreductase delta subunit